MSDESSQAPQPAPSSEQASSSSILPPLRSGEPLHLGAELKDLEATESKSRVPIVAGVVLVLLAAIVAVVSVVTRAKPQAEGRIQEAFAVALPGDNVLATIKLSFNNTAKNSLWIRDIQIRLVTADGQQYTDSAANAVDFERYFQGFPALRGHSLPPFKVETKVAPGEQLMGSVIAGFPVTTDVFNHRKSLSVLIYPYASAMAPSGGNQPAIVIGENF